MFDSGFKKRWGNVQITLKSMVELTGKKASILTTKYKPLKVPIVPNYKGVCLQNTSKSYSYRLNIWQLI